MKRKIVLYWLFIFLFVLTSFTTTTFSKYTQDVTKKLNLNVSQPKYTISFNKNSSTATGSTESVSCVYGTSCTLRENNFTNNGYTFAGWNTNADGTGTTYTTSALNLTSINNNTVTLYALWSAIDYNITYDLKGGSVTSNPTTYNADTMTFILNNPTRTGYTFEGWTGSNGSTPQTLVSIQNGSIGDKTYTANWYKNASDLTIILSSNTYTYDGNNKTPSVTVKDGSVTLVENVDYTISYSNNINAGTASVMITMKGTYSETTKSKYKNSATKNFTINKKEVTVQADDKSMIYGSSSPDYTSTISGVISGETAYTGALEYTIKNSGGSTVTINSSSSAGSYSITPGGLIPTNNYSITYSTGTLTISKATPTISLTAKTGMVYNGFAKDANNATVTLKNNETYTGSIHYTYYSDSTCQTKVTTSQSGAASAGGMPVYAGNWYVKASIDASDNYTSASSSCVAHTISKKMVNVTAENKSRVYGDSSIQTYSYTITGAIGSETAVTGTPSYTIKNSNGVTVTVNSSLSNGNYTITPSGLTATSNYTINYVSGTLTIVKATPTISLTSKTNMEYNASVQSANEATVILKNNETYSGTVNYVYFSDSLCTTQVATSNSGATSTGSAPKNAGNWYVKASIDASGNYNGTTTSCIAHTIAKATPVITLTNTPTTSINAGSTITFQEKANVSGKFVNSSSLIGAATVSPLTNLNSVPANTNTDVVITGIAGGVSTIAVTFTPDDMSNYNTITTSSSEMKTFSITVNNRVEININIDDTPWSNIDKLFIKLGTLDILGGETGQTSPFVTYGITSGTYAISSSIINSTSLINSGKSLVVTSSDGVTNNSSQTLNYYTITVNKGTCSSVTGSGVYLSNQTVNISATPGTGYTFTGWSVASGGNDPEDSSALSTTVSASKKTTLTANCLGAPHKLTLIYNHTQDTDFEYSGDYSSFIAPASLVYKFEAWGAQGGAAVTDGNVHTVLTGGEGAYTSGYMHLDEGEHIYVYVGQRPSSKSGGKANNPGGWNGGGTGTWDHKDNDSSGGGGGATDFRIYNSILVDFDELVWNNAKNLRNRIMVAAGGAGSGWASANRPYGGALQSTPAYNNNNIATQTSGNAFGVGGSGTNTATSSGISGGGGGYWGGHKGVASTTTAAVGTGGSSFISGYTGAVAVESENSNSPRFASDGVTRCANGTTDNVCSQHYSGHIFTDDPYTDDTMKILAGSEDMPAHDSDDEVTTTTGNSGNGYARISIASYQKDVHVGQEVGEIPSPMLEEGEILIVDGEPVLDEDGEPIIIGAQEINWLDENNNPVYEHTIYNLDCDATWHADGYRPKEYKITYVLNGGIANNPYHYNEETNTFTLQRPTREGYRFDGWTGSNGTTPQKDVTIEIGSVGNKEYTANWTPGSTLTVNANGGTYEGESPRIEPNGTIISVPIPVFPGRRFTGWTIESSMGGDAFGLITNDNPSTSSQLYTYGSGNDTITANWVDRDDITISFNTLGGSICPSKVGSLGDTWNNSCTPERDGYLFDGWYDKADGGNQVNNTGTFNDDLELYAHWIGGVAKIEMDYNINQTFGSQTMLDTYYSPDWSKSFDIDVSFTIESSGKRYLIIGNYDNSAANSLNVEVTQNNQIRIYVGKGTINDAFGTVSIGEENILHLHWDGSTKVMTGELSGAGSGSYSKTLNNLTGLATRNLRIGALDYREGSSNIFTAINVTNLVIGEYYESPLQAEFIVPDPAGHYLLFDGWTGANGTEPQYNVIVPLNSYGTVRYVANWSPGFSLKSYKSGNYSTSNQYIKFYYNITAVYADQARRKAYTYERVYFYRTNTGYTTYGTGSMTIKYNGTAYTKSITSSNEITNSGITLWSRYWNSRSNTFDTISYGDSGTKSVTIGISKFSHQKFSISGLPKNYTIALPEIKPISN